MTHQISPQNAREQDNDSYGELYQSAHESWTDARVAASRLLASTSVAPPTSKPPSQVSIPTITVSGTLDENGGRIHAKVHGELDIATEADIWPLFEDVVPSANDTIDSFRQQIQAKVTSLNVERELGAEWAFKEPPPTGEEDGDSDEWWELIPGSRG